MTTADSDARWLAVVMHSAFLLLVLASAVRFLTRHDGTPLAPWVIALTAALVVAYGVGLLKPGLVWLLVVLVFWMVLVVLAPSFAWSAIPLFVTGLRTLPTGPAVALVAVVTALVVVSQNRLADGFDPNLTIVPIAIALVTTAVITFMRRQTERLRESERNAGVLAERHRVSREIHDALAQGLSSQAMLLQAADQAWARPELAREHLRSALRVGTGNLSEARLPCRTSRPPISPTPRSKTRSTPSPIGRRRPDCPPRSASTATSGRCPSAFSPRWSASPRAPWPTRSSTPTPAAPWSPSPTSTTRSCSTSPTTDGVSP